jgi:hypothetical protein
VTEHEEFTEQLSQVSKIVDKIRPFLAGMDPEIVGAVLADLLAILLAGHAYLDDSGAIVRTETDQMREDLLTAHIESVRALIPVNEAMLADGS